MTTDMLPRFARMATRTLWALPLAACLYVPPVWDIQDPNNQLDSIRVGETTRTEVLSLLGESPSVCPGASTQNSRWYRYSGTQSAGRLAYAGGDRKTLAETPWYVNVYFNDNGVVQSIDTNPPPPSEGMESAPSQLAPDVFQNRSCPRS
jgi:outer membrane protein assembly factor BamE (lipoprotein component of BamABCDE complex)